MDLAELVRQANTNHYRMLLVLDNEHQSEVFLSKLEAEGWKGYDVEQAVLSMLEQVPENKVKLRISGEIKKWFLQLPERVVLYNTTILYSPELGRLNPVGAFKYKSRENLVIVLAEGRLAGQKLQYSEYNRPDYTEVDVSEIICARLEDIHA